MHNCFITIVHVIESREDAQRLNAGLRNLHGVLEAHFSDYEIILVNNTAGRSFDEQLKSLSPSLKQNIYQLNLSSPVNKNHAIIAGLDRANGDYTVIFESDFFDKPNLVLKLYESCIEGADIVYLRAKGRETKARFRPLYSLFYWILKRYSNLKIDDRAHDSRIISRRALNSLLRLRENLRYMKAIYSIVGYRHAWVEVEEPIRADATSFTEKFRTSLVAITSFTTFLRTLLLWIFLTSIAFMVLVTINAVKVKLTNVDLLGTYHETIPGWTFLVVISSVFFAITCLMLYIMSIYLANIYEEIKHRPMYIIESVKRY
jgi:glycosyltransferase involved in cell wall biosynthesis